MMSSSDGQQEDAPGGNEESTNPMAPAQPSDDPTDAESQIGGSNQTLPDPEITPNSVHVEDWILYASILSVVLVVVAMISMLLSGFFQLNDLELQYSARGSEDNTLRQFWELEDSDDLLANHLRAQLAVAMLRYNHAASAQLAQTVWRILGYFIGSLIALVGCLIAVRGVRAPIEGEVASEQVKAKVATSSVGAFVVLLGTLILLLTALDRDKTDIQDQVINLSPSYPHGYELTIVVDAPSPDSTENEAENGDAATATPTPTLTPDLTATADLACRTKQAQGMQGNVKATLTPDEEMNCPEQR